jgi:3-oxoacyl-[acyl-carrier protein] reductase
MKPLDQKVVLVSGGSRGIGEAIVLDAAESGATVVFSYHQARDKAEALVRKVEEAGGRARAIQADVKESASASRLLSAAVEAFGRVDGLVNNAGVSRSASVAFMSDESWDEVLRTNLYGAFYLSRLFIQYLLKNKKTGSIVDISSLSAVMGTPGQTNYAASKAGMIGFSCSLAKEVAPRGIRVNVVAPGFIDTDMVRSIPSDKLDAFLAEIPIRRLGQPHEVAKMVTFLLSDAASYMTGSVVRIDGGLGA